MGDVGSSVSCTVCGQTYPVEGEIPRLIVPKSHSEGEGTATFDYLTHYTIDSEEFDYFEEQTGATEHSERRLRETVLRSIPKTAQLLLDVGCGSAWLARSFQGSTKELYSLDASAHNPATAVAKYPWPGHIGVAADAFHLPFRDATFDCVVATEVIEHVVDPSAFVTELLRVTKPAGTLVISTPYKEVLRYALCIHCNQKTPLNAHLHSFDEAKLRAFGDGNTVSFNCEIFNNKLLLFTRTHVVLRYLPYRIWRIVDRIADLIYNKPVNIVCSYLR